MAKIICHPLVDGKELADGNHVLCRLSVLCHLFLYADGKDILCHQLADGKELTDGKFPVSSSGGCHE